ncbi:hypothetical protein OAL27_01260 [Verrucomicrobiales bacterium]|jgi:predicted RND superfamily exporter protein|nr:hypothetical protein [Verrucomicrobiales bacterium]MDC0312558.1 hypothetical protein [Verrucomicrobiales bacterium]
MSLKAFHIFFIFMSIVITFGFAAWVQFGATVDQKASLTIMSGISAVLGFGLIAYGIHFIRKSREIII